MNEAPLIHIGYHKTATTWMQTHLFTPQHGYRMLASHQEIHERIVRPHGLLFSARPMRELIAERTAGLPAGHVAVISSEILSGHPFYGGQMSDTYAERLHAIAPGAKILISIRAQLKILPSVYMQYLLRGGTMRYDQFFGGTDWPGFFGFEPAHFEFDRLVALYQQLFGAKNVFVLPQESLAADSRAVTAELARFAGNAAWVGLSDEARQVRGASYPEYAVPVLRRINHIQHSVVNPNPVVSVGFTPGGLYRTAGYLLRRGPFPALFGNWTPVTDYVRQAYAGHYMDSNGRLARLVTHSLDLGRYELPEPLAEHVRPNAAAM
ncbi:hypothetical protein HKCCE3408_17090 [Rhodobacterales bacterium HKCCE3408]|nr:hypothetical protein [Rhodobacterales bacterium HKCCE3408]